MSTSPEDSRTMAHWRQLVGQWRQSGLSMAAFARRQGITPTALAYWKKRVESDRPAVAAQPSSAPTFLPVTVAQTPSAAQPPPSPPASGTGASRFEVRLHDGLTVAVPPDFDPVALRRLLATLRGTAC